MTDNWTQTLMREDQKDEIEELKKRLQTVHDNMITSRSLYEEQQKLHQNLIERWNSRYDNQQKRVQAVIDIAELKRKSLYESLIKYKDNNRFSLENLLHYTPQAWVNVIKLL